MALSVDTTPAKHVTVLRNGDNKYQGRKFIISRRRYRTFDSLLSDITHQISAPFGAVRRLYTPKGSRQIQGIDDLEGGATYVAGGTERFKKIEYSPITHFGRNGGFNSNIKPGFLADDPPPLVLPKKNRKYAQRSAQFHKVRQPVQFTVFRNGLPSDKGARFLLKSREMKSFETVLSIISFKIRLVEGAVRKLYTVDGSLLSGPDDITDGGQYVACGHRRYMPGLYGEPSQAPKLHKLPAIKRNRYVSQQSPRTQSNPLPAIQKKAPEGTYKTARSDKDSPAPIAEEKGNEVEEEEELIVIVSRGSQVNVLEDNPTIEPLPADGVLGIESLRFIPTPPPPRTGKVFYDSDVDHPETEQPQEVFFEQDSQELVNVQNALEENDPDNLNLIAGDISYEANGDMEDEIKINGDEVYEADDNVHNEANSDVEDEIKINGDDVYEADDNAHNEVNGDYMEDEIKLNGEEVYEADDNVYNGYDDLPGTPVGDSQPEHELRKQTIITPIKSQNEVDHDQEDDSEVAIQDELDNEFIESVPDNMTVEKPLENGITEDAPEAVYENDVNDVNNKEADRGKSPVEADVEKTKDVPAGRTSVAEEVEVKEEPEMNGRESTIPDMMTEEGDVVDDAISRTEINTVPSKSKLPPSKRSNQAISSEDIQDVNSVTSVTSKASKPNITTTNSKTSVTSRKLNKKPSKKGGEQVVTAKRGSEELVTDDGLFNATGGTAANNNDGKFLMDNVKQDNHHQLDTEEEVAEDNDLVEDKPVELQKAEEVDED